MVNPKKLLKDLKGLSDEFKSISKLNKDGSYEVNLDEYKHSYEGALAFYWETGYEGHMASIVEDDRGLHEDGFHRSLSWAAFIEGGEFLQVYKDKELVWEGLLIRDLKKSLAGEKKPYFMAIGVEPKDWEEWFGPGEKYRGKIYTNKPVLAEDPKYKDYCK